MEMKKVNAGKLRGVGYDAGGRLLRIEFDDGRVVEYAGVPPEIWRRLSTSGSMWSFFRDNVDEEFSARRTR
jgi:hypothetical protein